MAEEFAFEKLPREAGQATVTKALSRRGLLRWRARARTLLPVPLSPSRRSVAAEAAALVAVSKIFWTRAPGVEIGEGLIGREHRFEFDDAVFEALAVFDPGQGLADLFGSEGLGDVVDRAAAHGFDGGVDRGVGGKNNADQLRVQGEKFRNQFQAVFAAKAKSRKAASKLLFFRRRGLRRHSGLGSHS